MKKILFTTIFCLAVTCISVAQISQGKFMAGGNFSAKFNKTVDKYPVGNVMVSVERKYTQVVFNPKFAYFITNDMALGLNIELVNNDWKDKDNNTSGTNSYFTVGPMFRYYFPMKIFIDANLGIGKEKNYIKYDEGKLLSYSIGAGYAAFLNNNVALEPIIRYAGVKDTNSDNDDYTYSDSGLEIMVGLQFYF